MKNFKELAGLELVTEGAMKGKWTSRKGWGKGSAATFTYKDEKIMATAGWNVEGFFGHITESASSNTLVDVEERQTFKELKEDFKSAGFTIPKDLKEKLAKAVLIELGL